MDLCEEEYRICKLLKEREPVLMEELVDLCQRQFEWKVIKSRRIIQDLMIKKVLVEKDGKIFSEAFEDCRLVSI